MRLSTFQASSCHKEALVRRAHLNSEGSIEVEDVDVALPNLDAGFKVVGFLEPFGTDAHRRTGKGSHYRESRPMGTLTNME